MCHSQLDMTPPRDKPPTSRGSVPDTGDRLSEPGDSAAKLRAIAERLDPQESDDGPQFADEEEITLVEIPQSMSPSKVVLGTVLAIPPRARAGLLKTFALCATLLVMTAILSDRLPGWMKWLLSWVAGAPKP